MSRASNDRHFSYIPPESLREKVLAEPLSTDANGASSSSGLSQETPVKPKSSVEVQQDGAISFADQPVSKEGREIPFEELQEEARELAGNAELADLLLGTVIPDEMKKSVKVIDVTRDTNPVAGYGGSIQKLEIDMGEDKTVRGNPYVLEKKPLGLTVFKLAVQWEIERTRVVKLDIDKDNKTI